jgi:hypothetical protein
MDWLLRDLLESEKYHTVQTAHLQKPDERRRHDNSAEKRTAAVKARAAADTPQRVNRIGFGHQPF